MPNVGNRVFLQYLSSVPAFVHKPPPCSSEHMRPQPFPGWWAVSGAAFWNLHIPNKLSLQPEPLPERLQAWSSALTGSGTRGSHAQAP